MDVALQHLQKDMNDVLLICELFNGISFSLKKLNCIKRTITINKRTYRSKTDSNKKKLSVSSLSCMYSHYDPHEIRLANEIAETLKDRDSLAMHLQYVRKYKEEFLRRILTKVMALPETQIRKSRAALYTFLINQGSHHGDSRH